MVIDEIDNEVKYLLSLSENELTRNFNICYRKKLIITNGLTEKDKKKLKLLKYFSKLGSKGSGCILNFPPKKYLKEL